MVRDSGFRKRSGYKPEELIEARLLSLCVGAGPSLAATEAINDPTIDCKASNSTLSRLYELGDGQNLTKFWRRIARGFGLGRGKVWAVDGTFVHVHGKKFESSEYGHDSGQGKTALGYLLITVFDLIHRRPVFWTLLPGNASEMLMFRTAIEEAISVTGMKPEIVVFDRGLLSKENVKWLGKRGILWVSQARSVMRLSDDNKSLTPKAWFDHYEMGKSRKVYWRGCGSLNLVKDTKVRGGREAEIRYLVGSAGLEPGRIIALYNMRWRIEEYHKQIRSLGLNILPTGRLEGLKLHVALVLLAFILLHSVAKALGLVHKSAKTIMRAICIARIIPCGLGPP